MDRQRDRESGKTGRQIYIKTETHRRIEREREREEQCDREMNRQKGFVLHA